MSEQHHRKVLLISFHLNSHTFKISSTDSQFWFSFVYFATKGIHLNRMVSLTNTNCTWKWILFDCDSPCNVPKRDLKQVLSLLNTWHNFGPQIVRAHSAFSICWLFLLKPTITECWVWIDHLLRNIRQGGRIYIRTIVTSFCQPKKGNKFVEKDLFPSGMKHRILTIL